MKRSSNNLKFNKAKKLKQSPTKKGQQGTDSKPKKRLSGPKKAFKKQTKRESLHAEDSDDNVDVDVDDIDEVDEVGSESEQVDYLDHESGAQDELNKTNDETENTEEPVDETSAEGQLKIDEEEGIALVDTFYERYVKKTTEDAINAQVKAHEKIATTNAAVLHKHLGTVIGTGAAAAGLEGAVGLAKDGVEHTEWLTSDSAPSSLADHGLRNRFLSAFSSSPATDEKEVDGFTPMQKALSAVLLSYSDVAYHCETFENHKQIIQCYVLHALNHVYRTRMVSYRNSLLRKENASVDISDQGFTRPRVLILTPLRNTAYDAVKFLCGLQNDSVVKKESFQKKFSPSGRKTADKSKPKDYQYNFRGNVDDMFTLGIAMKNDTSLSLDSSNLYHSDILVASPVALRLLIGSPGDTKRNFDFLSSIDMVIVDQMDMMLMQNWTHLTHIFDHLNLKPTTVRPGMDFSRTNEWALSNLTRHRRQTIFFSAFSAPDINALFNRKCFSILSIDGKIKITPTPSGGVIERVIPNLRQTFQRLECNTTNIADLDDQRFKVFAEEIFPHLSSTLPSRVLLFIPSYFDFLRIKELFQKEREPFCQANEYMKPIRVEGQCKSFSKNNVKWLLCTERCYYYNRMMIPRIRHVVFYAPPTFAQYYPELLNTIVSNDASCLVLYTKFDKLQLERVAGNARTQKMLTSNKNTFLFC